MRTAWTTGRLIGPGAPRLIFGRMYEDPEVEMRALPHGRVLAIASAGDVAFALAAAGRDIVAVDVNQAQVDYVRARIDGSPPRRGQAGRYLSVAARTLPLLGLGRMRLERFFEMDDPAAQLKEWRRIAGSRFRAGLAVAFGPLLRLAYRGDLAGVLPPGFALHLELRLERGFGIHPNRTNPVARSLFGLPAPTSVPSRIEVQHAEVVDFLRAQPAGAFDGFAFSNVTDGAPAGFRAELLTAARRVARPGAVAVLRTLGSPRDGADSDRAASDRALIWGGIEAVTLK